MKNKIVRALAIALAAAAAAGPAVPVMAATQYTGVNGDASTVIEKYLVMDKDARVPNAVFSYTIASGTPQAATETTMGIIAGSEAGLPVIKGDAADTTDDQATTTTFSPSDTDSAVAEGDSSLSGKTIDWTTSDKNDADAAANKDEKSAIKSFTVDFSNVQFKEPGIYRYILTETVGDQQGITYDTDNVKVLDVYVTDKDGTLEVSSYVLHDGADTDTIDRDNSASGSVFTAEQADEATHKLVNKQTGYTNSYATKDLTIGKKVTGNQASRDKYFKFTVKADKLLDADEFNVVKTHADAEPTKNNATTYEAADMSAANNVETVTGAELKAGKDFYLANGDYLTIEGLTKDSTYAVTEAAEDYTSKAADAYSDDEKKAALTTAVDYEPGNGVSHALTDAASGTIADADIYTSFQNTRQGVIPTGIILSIAPYLIGGAAAVGAGTTVAVSKSRKKKNET